VRIGAFSLHLAELTGRGRPFASAFALAAAPHWRPAAGAVAALPSPRPNSRALGLRGLAAAGAVAAPVEQLERLDELLRGAAKQGEGVLFSDQAREELGWSDADAKAVMRGLGFSAVGRGETQVWRRRPAAAPKVRSPGTAAASPFAALAALQPAAARRRRRRAPRKAHG
jgi:ATP-dependent RNA helicase SUPV3L1/SUV3